MTANDPPALSADELSVVLGGVEILRGVSLEVAAGEIVGVLGPSGAGKSTLFRALAGEVPLRAGRVQLGEHDVSRAPLWKRARLGLGYVPQTPSVLFDLDVAGNFRPSPAPPGRRPRRRSSEPRRWI
ncbi:MAG: ATP-binding cassette domain-containing protein [Myxococcales bacterium]|nr:ATP-binding cassette domain-containing protein [Myxococcales bacterium]